MRRRGIVALVVAAYVLALPAGVSATRYSNVTWFLNWIPSGFPATELCGQSGIVDTARNYNQALSKVWNYGACGASRVLPATFLGSAVYGYRDGNYCGNSGYYYSTVATAGWQLWATMCSNPAGSQSFHTVGTSLGKAGSGYLAGSVTSPAQSY